MMRTLICALFGLLLSAVTANASERIESFTSDATINADASLLVRETIVWNFSDIGSRRGLLRDFPTRYRDQRGLRVEVGFEVVSVRRDGQDEMFVVESISKGKRIRIGRSDVFLPEGRHTYEITYRTTRQLGFFQDYDELYWNVTGNAWDMPIDEAMAIVRLPPGTRFIQHEAYTGAQGDAGRDFRVLSAEGMTFRAETTQPLAPGEGFTVAVGFMKGAVAAPTMNDRLRWYVRDNAGLSVLAASLLAVLAYFGWAWNRVGRDPPAGTIIPLFSGPAGMGPAAMRYVWRQSFDDKGFAAALVGLAVKGRARIIDDDGTFAVEKLAASGPDLLAGERVLFDAMKNGTVTFKQSNHQTVRSMRGALQKAIEREFDGVAFIRNLKWSLGGLGLSIVGLLAGAFFLPAEEAMTGLFLTVWAGIWWSATLAGLVAALRGLWTGGLGTKTGSIFSILFLIPFVIAGTVLPTLIVGGMGSPGLYALMGTGVLMALLNVIFFRLMRAPTIHGRKLLDQIEGFRMYLATAEEDRLNALHPPEKTPTLFEKFLPYAIALDCENEWAAKFTAVLAAAGIAAPAWYAGTHWNAGNIGGFTKSLGSGLAASTAAASTPPGSRSGSGGGGSAGGGGGGGGGSSW
jgi:hypothetical protein